MLIGINGGYFPAICRVCFIFSGDFYALNFLRRLNFSLNYFEQMNWSGGSLLTVSQMKI